MFGKIEGQRLHLAKMYIANYCIALEAQAGSIDIRHVVLGINDQFCLVSNLEGESLVSDINYFYNCLINQKIKSIDRGSYWKFRAISPLEAKKNLVLELEALKA